MALDLPKRNLKIPYYLNNVHYHFVKLENRFSHVANGKECSKKLN